MPETKVHRCHKTYVTNNGKPLVLEVSIGNSNPGGIAVSWEKKVTTIQPDQEETFTPSDGSYGKRMVIAVLTRDVQKENNMTSVRVVLKTGDGKAEPLVLDMSEDANVNEGEVLYDIIIDAV